MRCYSVGLSRLLLVVPAIEIGLELGVDITPHHQQPGPTCFGRPLPRIIVPIVVRGNKPRQCCRGESYSAAATFAAGRRPAGYLTPSASKQIQPSRIAPA